ncbi:hypothetical protein ACLOJK_032353 [Asimina triloba]
MSYRASPTRVTRPDTSPSSTSVPPALCLSTFNAISYCSVEFNTTQYLTPGIPFLYNPPGSDAHSNYALLRIVALCSIGGAALAILYRNRRRAMRDSKVVPRLALTDSGRVDRIERFPQYVARQMGFEDTTECPQLCTLAYDYLRKSKGCEDNIYSYFSNDPNAEFLYGKLVEELDRCMLAYFAFHWNHASDIVCQVLSTESKPKPRLKNIVLAATSIANE